MVREAVGKVGGNPPWIEAIHIEREIAVAGQNRCPFFKLAGHPIGDGIIRPQTTGAMKHQDRWIGAGAMDFRIRAVKAGNQGQAIRGVRIARHFRQLK